MRLLLAVMAFVGAVGGTIPALAAGEGSISGQVVNKTAGGTPVAAAEVTLATYTNNSTISQKSIADAAGKFEFKGLSVAPGTTYTVGTTFQDAEYISEVVTLTADRPVQNVTLNVYESTTSDGNIQVSNGHIVVGAERGALHMLEVWRFYNAGNKTYIGTKRDTGRATLRFTLPAGAQSVEGPGIEVTPGGAVYASVVPPGVTDITITYFVPVAGTGATIVRKTDYPIADFRLLVEDTGVRVTSTTLAESGSQNINGVYYLDFAAANVASGTDLGASFSNVIAPTSTAQSSFPWQWLLGGVVLLGVMLAVASPQLRKRQAAIDPPETDVEDDLIGELARLDDAYAAGTVQEEPYRKRRAQVKMRLMAMYGQRKG